LQEQSALQTRTSRASSRSKAASSSVNKSQQKALDEMKKQGRGKSKKDDAMVQTFSLRISIRSFLSCTFLIGRQ
jgi:hypothetical protein